MSPMGPQFYTWYVQFIIFSDSGAVHRNKGQMIYIGHFCDYSSADIILYFSDSDAVHRNKGHMICIEHFTIFQCRKYI